jgi:predicted transcriptional regulator
MSIRRYDETYPDVHYHLERHDPRIALYMPDSFRRKQFELELAIGATQQETVRLSKQAFDLQALLHNNPFTARVSALKDEYAKAIEIQAQLATQNVVDNQLKKELEKLKQSITELENKRSKLENLMTSLIDKIKATVNKIQTLQAKRSGLLERAQNQIATIRHEDAIELSKLLDSHLLVTESGQAVHISDDELSQHLARADEPAFKYIAENVKGYLQPKFTPAFEKESAEKEDNEELNHLFAERIIQQIINQRGLTLKQAFLANAIRSDFVDQQMVKLQPAIATSGKKIALVYVEHCLKIEMFDADRRMLEQEQISLSNQLGLRSSEFSILQKNITSISTMMGHLSAKLGVGRAEAEELSNSNAYKPAITAR